MKELILPPILLKHLEGVYQEMEMAYNDVANAIDFSCEGCPDNCCDSYFQHHTYIEWCYLWLGLRQMAQETQNIILARAKTYLAEAKAALSRHERPQAMCPLNSDGLCMIYRYRLMVCRTHGVPATITRPDGQRMSFPGCFRCQEQVVEEVNPPYMERTSLLRRLALLENDLLCNRRHLYPRVKLTIAEMLVKGPPQLPLSCSNGEQ